jgi:hypothetical protein
MVGVEEPPGAEAGSLVPDQRLVDAAAVDVASQETAGAVIFRDQRAAVVGEASDPGAAARSLQEPPRGIVQQGRCLAAAGARQAVLDIVAERDGAVGGEVAVAVMGKARRARAGIVTI